MVGTRNTVPSWMSAAASRVDFDGKVSAMSEVMFSDVSAASPPQDHHANTIPDENLGFTERAISAAGAAFLSAILVNPLDVAKTRWQAQAAGVPYSEPRHCVRGRMASMFTDLRCSPSCLCGGTVAICPPDCFQYRGTLDVFYKIIRQEGFARLWRGTNASLTLAIPTVGIYLPCYDVIRNSFEEFTTEKAPSLTPYVPLVAGSVARCLACITCYPIELARTRMQAFKVTHADVKPPGVRKTLLDILSPLRSTNKLQNLQNYRLLWTGVGAQIARDVPFSAICWSTLEPIRRRILGWVGEEANAASILGANFSAGFVAGSLAAAATCPLDVVKTRRQIELAEDQYPSGKDKIKNDPARALRMTTRQTLMEVWRDGKMKGLFTGVGPRVARAGPSVGIVVSFYEVVKYYLHHRHIASL